MSAQNYQFLGFDSKLIIQYNLLVQIELFLDREFDATFDAIWLVRRIGTTFEPHLKPLYALLVVLVSADYHATFDQFRSQHDFLSVGDELQVALT